MTSAGRTSTPLLGRIPLPSQDSAEVHAAVIAAARDLVQFVMSRRPGWSPPPFDPLVFAEELDIPVTAVPGSDLRIGERTLDAMLLPTGGRFAIFVNAGANSRRKAFSVAHEISHTFFSNAADALQKRSQSEARSHLLERLVDAGAAELLMPRPWFEQEMRAHGLNAAAVPALAEQFSVSLSAAARRVVEVSERPSAVVFFEDAARPSGGGPWTYRVKPRMSFRSDGFPHLFPAGKSVPPESVIHRCSLRTHGLEGEELFELGRQSHRLRVSAFPLHRREGFVEAPPLVCAAFEVAQE